MPESQKEWQIFDAIDLCRLIEQAVKNYGYHVALGGSVLMHGRSTKDVDIFVYPHNTKLRRYKRTKILKVLEKIGIITNKKVIFGEYDNKCVYISEYNGQRVDLFFVK